MKSYDFIKANLKIVQMEVIDHYIVIVNHYVVHFQSMAF